MKKNPDLQKANRMSDCQVIVTAQEGYLRNALERGTDDARMRSARKEDNPHKIIILRQRFPTESSSSRASFTSSSRSSSLSSLLEQGSPVKTISSETVSGDGNKSFQVRRQSLDLQEFVKDSMEAQNSSTEVETAEVRDISIVSAVDVMNLSLKQSSAGINEHEGVYRSSSAVSRNASYNGRELSRASYDSKLQDYPRVYLGCLKTDLNSSFDDNIQTTQGNKGRAPSVVAKLMGLETLPSSASSSEINMGSSSLSYEDKDIVRIPSSFKLSSAKNSWKERSSPPWKIHDGTAKPSSLFPIEPAPWKNVEKARIQQKVAPRSSNSSMKVAYSEIEKRLKDLEFLVSGKNLGETKQTIEAVEVKEVLPENAKGGHGSNFRIHEEETKQQQQLKGSVRSVENQVVSSKSDIGTSTNEESPIVIKKPAKCVNFSNESPIDNRDCSNSGTAGKEPNLGNGEIVLTVNSVRVKNDPTTKTSMKPQQMSKDGGTGPGKKISGSITSSRMQQKKLDIVEKRSVKSEIQSNKKQSEPKSSVGRRRLKNFQTSDEKLSESSVDSSNSCETSVRCSRNGSPINSRRTSSTGSVKSTRVDAPESLPSGVVKKKLNLMLKEDESAEHFAYSSPVSVLDSNNKNKDSLSSPRQYVRKIAGAGTSKCKDGNSELAQRSSESSLVSTSSELGSVFGINRKKLKDIDSLVQKLRSLNSDHDETRVDYIASLCESSNQDHRYVSEILLASGLLLRDFTSTATDYQFHSSECPLNPKLFLVLERTRESSLSEQEGRGKKTVRLTAVDKVDRKLIFDTVNEILARKFVGSSSNPRSRPLKLTRSSLTARKLLKELCSDIEELQNRSTKCSSKEDDAEWKTILFDDVMHHSEKWIDFDTEISGAVLDIERLIFKDLVKEIVVGGEM